MRGISGYPRPRSRPVLHSPVPSELPPAPPAPPAFVRLSAVLTGFDEFDLLGTGVADLQYGAMIGGAGSKAAAEIIATFETLEREHPHDLDEAVRVEILESPWLGPVARAVAKAWYTGVWVELDGDWLASHSPDVTSSVTRVIAPETYVESLAWVAAGAHPAGAKAPGFGSWSTPPTDDVAAS